MPPDYFDRYPTIAFERDDTGVLVMRLHSDGGPVIYSHQHHSDWSRAFREVAMDRDNRVVVFTGSGDAFCNAFGPQRAITRPCDWDHIYSEGKQMLRDLLEIPVPVIGAVNGPATIHAELPLLSDITLASETAVFQDAPHIGFATVPGDGVHVFWLDWLGTNRGRYFLMTGQELSADEAQRLGVVNEILPPEELMPRALELAHQLAGLPDLTLRYTRILLTQRLKRLLDEGIGHGLALEGLAALEMIIPRAQPAGDAQ
ncbi:MAG: crotonase [Deltaproteobacteria bacterium]|jgi:enoyl-CoA hydratase/carnithine racemase|nr:crotonase [Deltaproteobacteria bacterium]